MRMCRKIGAIALILFLGMSSLYSENGIQVGEDAPEFEMYLYKDKTFNTDDYYGKKIVAFVFGSIT